MRDIHLTRAIRQRILCKGGQLVGIEMAVAQHRRSPFGSSKQSVYFLVEFQFHLKI